MKHNEQLEMAIQVNQLLPETKVKVDYYKSILLAEDTLIKELKKEIDNKKTTPLDKARLQIELIKTNNSIYAKKGVYEEYLSRKQKYETWLDEMSREVNMNFKETMEKAVEIKDNVRLVSSLQKWKETKKPSIQSKIEFYLYLKQEILNNEKYGKNKKGKIKKLNNPF
jgi:hypothetical protein